MCSAASHAHAAAHRCARFAPAVCLLCSHSGSGMCSRTCCRTHVSRCPLSPRALARWPCSLAYAATHAVCSLVSRTCSNTCRVLACTQLTESESGHMLAHMLHQMQCVCSESAKTLLPLQEQACACAHAAAHTTCSPSLAATHAACSLSSTRTAGIGSGLRTCSCTRSVSALLQQH